MAEISTVNPYTEHRIASYPLLSAQSPDDISPIIESCHESFLQWRITSIERRCELIRAVAHHLLSEKFHLARLMSIEMGKPIAAAEVEIEKCAWVCNYYADKAPHFLADIAMPSDYEESYVAFEPLGVILAVMPWNFPFWQVFRFAAPALIAGNTCVLKHATNVSGCALAIEEIFSRASLPANTFRTLIISSDHVAQVIDHAKVRAVSLTGSEAAGSAVAAAAGKQLKKSLLELGGSDPYLILEDADIELAAKLCCASRLNNSGQSCIAAKRFIVIEEIREQFEQAVVKHMEAAKYGDPLDRNNTLGPLARGDLRDALHAQVTASIEHGAKCLTGGKVPEMEGYFYPPTVLTGVTKGCPAYGEELFGPVASIISAVDENEAIRIANDTRFGLGSAIFSTNIQRAKSIAAKLEAGSCFINDFVKSDPRLPFGGIKSSGYGRELSEFGIREFVNIKTVAVAS